MKKIFLALIILLGVNISDSKAQNYITIPDPNFVAYLQAHFPNCINGNQLDTTCNEVLNTYNLDCSQSNISNLEGIRVFHNLDVLECNDNQLTSLPVFPSSLKSIDCYNNQLTYLSNLPDSLWSLYCWGNQLMSLPNLPNTLKGLLCNNNYLTSLPSLPNSMYMLDCSYNQLTTLPTLPDSLFELYCSFNQITSLPALPNKLIRLYCNNNQIVSLTNLPAEMDELIVSNNPALACLPGIQIMLSVTETFDISNTAIVCLPNLIQHPNIISFPAIDTMPICGIFNANGCDIWSNISGSIESDNDLDCTTLYDGTSLNNIKIELLDTNGNLLQENYSFNNGEYLFFTMSGNYTIRVDTTQIQFNVLCPTINQVDSVVTTIDSANTIINFRLACKSGYDIGVNSIYQNVGLLFPNNNAFFTAQAGDFTAAYNVSCNTSSLSGTVTAVITGPINIISASSNSIISSSISGNTITWNVVDFSLVDFYHDFSFELHTNTLAQISDQVCIDVNVSPSTGSDTNTSNNSLTQCFTVLNSFDPNIKEVYPNHVEQSGQWLTYTIHFQNTGTAEAEHIQVLDTLDTNLDWSTFNLTAASHENITQVYNTTGIVKFNFPNINLADSNSNEPASHGWTQYRIKMKDNLTPPVFIHNTAAIYFDFNDPVITNDAVVDFNPTAVKVFDTEKYLVRVYPNPAREEFKIQGSGFKICDEIIVSDLAGRKILTQIIISNKTTINVAAFTPGLYIVEVRMNDGAVVKRKFVKE